VDSSNSLSNFPKANDVQFGGDHYKTMALQPWDVMEAVLTRAEFIGFLKGNIIKYTQRAGKKPGADPSVDMEKAAHYRMKLREVIAANDSTNDSTQ
jgi:hypothetical protein